MRENYKLPTCWICGVELEMSYWIGGTQVCLECYTEHVDDDEKHKEKRNIWK